MDYHVVFTWIYMINFHIFCIEIMDFPLSESTTKNGVPYRTQKHVFPIYSGLRAWRYTLTHTNAWSLKATKKSFLKHFKWRFFRTSSKLLNPAAWNSPFLSFWGKKKSQESVGKDEDWVHSGHRLRLPLEVPIVGMVVNMSLCHLEDEPLSYTLPVLAIGSARILCSTWVGCAATLLRISVQFVAWLG